MGVADSDFGTTVNETNKVTGKVLLSELPRDKDELSGVDNDISHIHGRRVFIMSVGTVLVTVLVAVGFWLL